MENLDTHELAWAAGFFDGEGCFSNGRSGSGGPTPMLAIGQASSDGELPQVLSRFADAIQLPARFYPMRHTNPRWKQQFKLVINGFERTQAAFGFMWPWLGDVKRAQGTAVLRRCHEYRSTSNWVGYRTHCPQGHPYDEANTVRPGDGSRRQCRACRTSADRARKERLRAQRILDTADVVADAVSTALDARRLGLCECGCGEAPPVAAQTRARYDHVKGQPVRFVKDHWFRLPRRAFDLIPKR